MSPGSFDNPLRVAVVGSGPAGFYAAGHLLSAKDVTVEVDMFDRLPTPFGLVRAGVAPDHPKIKSVTRVYEKTAAKPEFRFFGNVHVGRDIGHEDLRRHYHAIVYSFGAETDRQLGIPGEDLPGSWAATQFVAWYNGHPDYRDLEFDLSCERVAVIGNGNVAMDVARMLVLPREELVVTDTADHAIEALSESKVKEVYILGRRGPAQAAFTNPELRELGELTDADVIVEPFELDRHSAQSIEGEGDITPRRNVEILQDFAAREPTGKSKRVVLRFLVSPVEIRGDGRVEQLELVRNELEHGSDGGIRAQATGEHETLDVGLVFRSIGYRGIPLEGVPFDEWKGTIPNEEGRVVDPHEQRTLPGVYVAGWIKRGPSGVIGTNKRDAQETVEHLLEDAREDRLPAAEHPARDAIEELLAERQPEFVEYSGWELIDAAEKAAGEPHGRPRVKLTRVAEMLEAAKRTSSV
ncbi:MAG TPA: FAD-dependent oxidoreductase [Thermoleophilaceae bacterium]|nr:FAD-dependent oxidoreductase [Thermoleophilaceae bacterium]